MSLPDFNILQAAHAATGSSEMVKAAAQARKLFGLLFASAAQQLKAGFKPLSPAQIRMLKAQGNTAEDWKTVWVGPGFEPTKIQRCNFLGSVLLSACSGDVEVEGVTFPTGLQHATISSCVIGKNAFIRNVRLLNRTVIGEGVVLFDVGTLTAGEADSFANGLEVLIAIETGGREIRLFSELTVDGAWVLARSRADKGLLESYNKSVDEYVKAVTAPCNVIGPGARILHAPKVESVLLGPSAMIDNPLQVSHVTVLSSKEEKTEISNGAIVKNSILQWGSEVTSGALVDSSLLTEHSHVERGGFVTHSILGPNTGVAEGEVTSCLLGPFVGFHHQSLLIAALWPEGKGNVGYGANVGSNHTAKAPDQEIWPGEGTFFGLGVNIKFPSDLTRSPYTIIASGVNMLPQRVEFPFSLINTPAAVIPGVSPAYTEIMPAWVLSDNIYMVKRNEGKYAKRNKARRSKFDFEVFRPEIVDLMLDARRRLQVSATKELYTSKEIEGLGKSYLSERSRAKAVETYTFYIKYYALLGLKRELEAALSAERANGLSKFLATSSRNPRWEHERKLLIQEFSTSDVAALLRELSSMQEKIAQDVQTSKEKDDHRGAEVIEDYAQAHKPASADSFVKETWGHTEKLKADIEKLIKQLQKATPTGKTQPASA